MKKLLFQLDTDPIPNLFDTIVGYDGGADHVNALGGIAPDNVAKLIDGAIFTRPPANKKLTALFVTGSNMAAGEALLSAITRKFFGNFRVSVMLDSNGANTTAAAAVAQICKTFDPHGKRAVILAGTGPVGQRVAVMLATAGAEVCITSRQLDRAAQVCDALNGRFKVAIRPQAVADPAALNKALDCVNIVVATGAPGVSLLPASEWQQHPTLEIIMDANATPPQGIEGLEMKDRATVRHGKRCFGALGFGGFKLEVHRACVAKLFDANDQIFDAPEVFAVAKALLAARS